MEGFNKVPFGKHPIIHVIQFLAFALKDRILTQNQIHSKGQKFFSGRTLSSESFGAGFGSALATIDANGDGRDDLLVGLSPTDGTTHLFPLMRI